MKITTAKETLIALATTLALSAPALSGAPCNDDDVYAFIAAFQNTPSEQAHMSADPIEITTFQAMGSAMPARHTELRRKADLDWPILPSLQKLHQQDLEVRIYQDSPSKAELYARATDRREIDLVWHFERNPCWALVGFTDGSLHR